MAAPLPRSTPTRRARRTGMTPAGRAALALLVRMIAARRAKAYSPGA